MPSEALHLLARVGLQLPQCCSLVKIRPLILGLAWYIEREQVHRLRVGRTLLQGSCRVRSSAPNWVCEERDLCLMLQSESDQRFDRDYCFGTGPELQLDSSASFSEYSSSKGRARMLRFGYSIARSIDSPSPCSILSYFGFAYPPYRLFVTACTHVKERTLYPITFPHRRYNI